MKEDDSQNGATAGTPVGKKGTRASPQDFVQERLEDLGQWQNNLIGSISGTKVEKDFLAHVNDDLARRYARGRQLSVNEEAGSKSSLSAADLKAIAVYRKLHNELPASMPFYNREALAKDIDRGIMAKASAVSGEARKTVKEKPVADAPSPSNGNAVLVPRVTTAAHHKSTNSAEPSRQGREVMAFKSAKTDKTDKTDGSQNKTQAPTSAKNQKEEKFSPATQRDNVVTNTGASRRSLNSGEGERESRNLPGQLKENLSQHHEKPLSSLSGAPGRSAEFGNVLPQSANALPQLTQYLKRQNERESQALSRPLSVEIAASCRQSLNSVLNLPWRRSLNSYAGAMGESDQFKLHYARASKEASKLEVIEGQCLSSAVRPSRTKTSFAEVVNKIATILTDDCLVLKRDFKAAGDCQFFLSLRPFPAQLVQALKKNDARKDDAPVEKSDGERGPDTVARGGQQRELSAARKELSLLLPLIQLRCALWRADDGRHKTDEPPCAGTGQSARQGLAATIRQIREKSQRRESEAQAAQPSGKIYHLKNFDSSTGSNARQPMAGTNLVGEGNCSSNLADKKGAALRPGMTQGAGKRLITSGDFALLLVFALVSASRTRVTSFQGEFISPVVCERLLFEHPSNHCQKAARRAQIAVQAQDNLEGLAQELFQDTVIGHLIADLNLAAVEEEYWQGKRIIRLKRRQRLMLPVYDDIQHYFQANTQQLDKLRKQEIVTIIEDEQLDDEYVYAKLAGILSTGAGKEAARPHAAEKQRQVNNGSKEGWYADPVNYRAAIFREDLISTLGQDGNHFQILDGNNIIQSKKRKDKS
jgi:hypothetical protein